VPLSTLVLSASLAETARPRQPVQSAAATPTAAAAVSPDDVKQRAQELEDARAAQKSAAESQAKLQADIASIGQDRSKLNQQLIDVAARVRSIEGGMGDTEARLRALEGGGRPQLRLAGE